jgi:hypothetical protein
MARPWWDATLAPRGREGAADAGRDPVAVRDDARRARDRTLPPVPTETLNGIPVVIAYMDKRRDRGYLKQFRPFDTSIVLHAPDAPAAPGREIPISDLKSIYFVRTLTGNKAYQENKRALPPVYRQGRKIEVSFPDGEIMVGTTDGFSPARTGFTFYPADPKSNNLEIFVVWRNAEEIRILGAGGDGKDVVHHPRGEKGVFQPEKRLEAVLKVNAGLPPAVVAKQYSVPVESVIDWVGKFRTGGPAALGVAPSGPPGGAAGAGGPAGGAGRIGPGR